MSTYELKHPIAINGLTVTQVTLRRPKARDMIELGDHFAALGELAERPVPNKASYKAMVAVAATLADMGDAALDLDVTDLAGITTEAFALLGESPAGGTATNGDTPLPSPPAD